MRIMITQELHTRILNLTLFRFIKPMPKYRVYR
jgi:hypothetical protein